MLGLFIKKWVLLFIVIISSLIIGMRVPIGFFHLLFWFLTVTVAINIIWVAIVYFGLKLHLVRKTVSKIREDDSLEIETWVKNDSFLPGFNIVLADNLSCADFKQRKKFLLIEHLAAKSFVNLRYSCRCPMRGKYNIGPLVVYFFDPFGIFFLKKTFRIYSELYVYPQTFAIKRFPDLVKGVLPWFGIDTSRVRGDEDEFFGIREYKEGDPIKRIHWVSSARNNTLIVKQFQRQSFFRATIMFNLEKEKNFGEGKEKVAEYIVKIAASICQYLAERAIDISLQVIVHADRIVHIPFNKGEEHLEDINKFLATAQAESKFSLAEILEGFSGHIPNDSTLIVIMLDKDWQYLQDILQLKARNIFLIPLILISSTFLSSFDKQEVAEDMKIKLSHMFNFRPMLISCHDNLEEAFLKY